MILEYSFVQNALLGSLLASIACGLVGTYIVARRLVLISGGITHASFGGIGLGVYFGVNPIPAAMAFAVASACGVQWMSARGRIREDSAIAVFWTFGMSLGIIFSFMTPGFVADLSSYLFGSILAIGPGDLWVLGIVAAAVVATFALLMRTIVCTAFDPVFARSLRLPVPAIEYIMMALTAMTIVATLRLVGIVLAISLLTMPQLTAGIFTYSFPRMATLSILFGMAYCAGGLAVSYWLNVPSGASIIFVSIIIYAALKTIKTAAAKFM